MKIKNIILVDDQESYRKTLKSILDIIGGVKIVGEASNGKEYLELLENVKPDITFMDIEMPEMDGIEATKRAIEIDKSLVIIGLSLYANEDYVNRLIEVGARGYLLKLSNNYDLFKTIINYPDADVFFSEKIKKIREEPQKKIKTVLIVDDFETNTIVVASALKTAGYRVLKATNAEEGIKLAFNENELDLIIADYNMPGKNGAQMISEIKKLPGFEKIPSLILSSDTDPKKKQEAKKAGAAGWVKKPFQLAKFLTIVDKITA